MFVKEHKQDIYYILKITKNILRQWYWRNIFILVFRCPKCQSNAWWCQVPYWTGEDVWNGSTFKQFVSLQWKCIFLVRWAKISLKRLVWKDLPVFQPSSPEYQLCFLNSQCIWHSAINCWSIIKMLFKKLQKITMLFFFKNKKT